MTNAEHSGGRFGFELRNMHSGEGLRRVFRTVKDDTISTNEIGYFFDF